MSAFTIDYCKSKQRCFTALDDVETPVENLLPIIMEASMNWPVDHERLKKLVTSQLAVGNRQSVRLLIEKAIPDIRLRFWIKIPLFPFVLVFRILAAILKLGRV